MTRIVGYNLLKTAFVLYVGTILLTGCGSPAESKSSEANISELTLTIGGKGYQADFSGGTTAMIELPTRGNVPQTVTVASVTLSAGASGLATEDELKVSNNQISITVTAEDGTTVPYTVSLTFAIDASELARSESTETLNNNIAPDKYRVNYVTFSIEAASAGDYRLALRAASEDKPTVSEIKGASATIVRSLTSTPINVFMGFHMDTTLFDALTDWTSASYKGAFDRTLQQTVVDGAALQAGTAYKLFAVKEEANADTVYELLSFTTDAPPSPTIGGVFFYNFPTEHTYTLKTGEPFLLQALLRGILVGSIGVSEKASTGTLIAITTLSYTSDSVHLPSPGANPVYSFASLMTSEPKSVSLVSKEFRPSNEEFIGFKYEHGIGHIIEANFTILE